MNGFTFDSELEAFIEKECQHFRSISKRPPFVINRDGPLNSGGFSAERVDDAGSRTVEKIRVEPRTWNGVWCVFVAVIDGKQRLVIKSVGGGGFALRLWLGHDQIPSWKLIAKPELEPPWVTMSRKRQQSSYVDLSSDSDLDDDSTSSPSPSVDGRYEDPGNLNTKRPTTHHASTNPSTASPATGDVTTWSASSDGHRTGPRQGPRSAKRPRLEIQDRKAMQTTIGGQPVHATNQRPRRSSSNAQAQAEVDRTLPTVAPPATHQDQPNAKISQTPEGNSPGPSAHDSGPSSHTLHQTAPITSTAREREALLKEKRDHLKQLIESEKALIELDNQLIEYLPH